MRHIVNVFIITCSIPLFAAQFEIYKSPACGCCQKWADALVNAGHQVTTHHVDDLHKIKFDAGLPAELGSCHTAFVEGYVVEGHLPVQAIDELLEAKPDIKGIAVPGMPGESLGMEQGGNPQPYVVYGFDEKSNFFPVSTYVGTTKIK